MTSDSAWRSFHIFLWDAAKADRFLAQIMLPRLMREGARVRWFFIRYWEGGPHIRLRLQADGSLTETLIADLARTVAPYLSPGLITAETYYRNNVFERPIGDIAAMPWFEEGAIEEIAYVPEVTRYGGPAALPRQERLFELSSRLAAKIILATQEDWPRRATLAVQLMIAAALSVTRSADEAGQFFESYAEYWKSFARNDQDSFLLRDYDAIRGDIDGRAGRTLPHIWMEALKQANVAMLELGADDALRSPQSGLPFADAHEMRQALRTIVASQIHMLNNRLGIGPEREHAFALAIASGARTAPDYA